MGYFLARSSSFWGGVLFMFGPLASILTHWCLSNCVNSQVRQVREDPFQAQAPAVGERQRGIQTVFHVHDFGKEGRKFVGFPEQGLQVGVRFFGEGVLADSFGRG